VRDRRDDGEDEHDDDDDDDDEQRRPGDRSTYLPLTRQPWRANE